MKLLPSIKAGKAFHLRQLSSLTCHTLAIEQQTHMDMCLNDAHHPRVIRVSAAVLYSHTKCDVPKNRQKKSNLQDLQIAFRLLILRQYISARNGLICKSLRAFVFLPASPGFQTCRYWIGGTRCQPSIGVRTRHSRGHALTSNMQMSATSAQVEVRTLHRV